MYAIIKTGGKQYKVEQGDELFIEKLNAEAEEEVTFDEVIALSKGGKTITTGKPFVKGVSVKAVVLKNGKSKKVTVFTYRPKKDSKRKMGHRQWYTKVKITDIVTE